MSAEFACYRCGESLDGLSLPLSRRDMCPVCSAYLHACRMCRHYAAGVPRQCREDGAEDVANKETPNFCDWFEPAAGRFDAGRADEARRARDQLAALFGDGDSKDDGVDPTTSEAENLFR